ncbi:MAG: PspA/IM30 family protein [Phycisphaerae bacterium]|nr:PspA/IM30 family protein [Phycisphaerae bacterium]
MSLIKKLQLITMGRIEAFLDSIEQPEHILPQLQKELAQKLSLAIKAQAKSLTAVKASSRKLDETNGKLLRFQKLTETALKTNDENLARKALAAQLETEEQQKLQENSLTRAEDAYKQAMQVRIQLQDNLNNLKQKCKELQQRNLIVKQKQKIQNNLETQTLPQGDSILEAISRMEAKIEEKEIELEVNDEIFQTIGFDIDTDTLANLQRQDEIERRLTQLKKTHQTNTEI